MITAQTRSAIVSYGKTGFRSAIQVPGMLFRIMLYRPRFALRFMLKPQQAGIVPCPHGMVIGTNLSGSNAS
jgi:hypothetical protein